ncbi:MAG: hypothetical protein ABIB71_05750 [Candidatus Woesearchaeota archaeon]
MDLSYLKQFSNENIEKYVFKEETLPQLEQLLEEKYKELGKINSEHLSGKKTEFGKRVRQRNLQALMEEVKGRVDNFLEIEGLDTPRCRYFSLFKGDLNEENRFKEFAYTAVAGAAQATTLVAFSIAKGFMDFPAGLDAGLDASFAAWGLYSLALLGFSGFNYQRINDKLPCGKYQYSDSQILLKRKTRVPLILSAAHEYSHYILHKRFLSSDLDEEDFNYFDEGFAERMGGHMAALYSSSEDNDDFRLLSCHYDVVASKQVQNFISSILELNQQEPDKQVETLKSIKMPDQYEIGNTFFMLLEQKYGNSVYKDILNEKFNLE